MSDEPTGRGRSHAPASIPRSSMPPRKHTNKSGLLLCSSVRKSARSAASPLVSSSKFSGSASEAMNHWRSSWNHPAPAIHAHSGRNAVVSQTIRPVIAPDARSTRMFPPCKSPCEKKNLLTSTEGPSDGELGYRFGRINRRARIHFE